MKPTSKHTRQTKADNRKSLRMLIASMVSMCLCVVLFAGSSWAWFHDAKTSVMRPMRSGKWAIKINVTDAHNETTGYDDSVSARTVSLAPNGTYTVQLIPHREGKTAGYCYVTFGGKTYYTTKIGGSSFAFTVDTHGQDQEVTLTVVSKWGSLAPEEGWQPFPESMTLGADPTPTEESTTVPQKKPQPAKNPAENLTKPVKPTEPTTVPTTEKTPTDVPTTAVQTEPTTEEPTKEQTQTKNSA